MILGLETNRRTAVNSDVNLSRCKPQRCNKDDKGQI